MTSLGAHFVRPDDHDRLPFHPECPRCRAERLEGSLPEGPVVPLKAQAAITAGVLAFTSVAPTAAFATGVDDEMEGTAVPEQVTSDTEGEGELDPVPAAAAEPADAAPAATDAPVVEKADDEATAEPDLPPAAAPRDEAESPAEEPAPPAPAAEEASDAAPAAGQPAAQPVAAPAVGSARAKAEAKARAKTEMKAKRELKRVKRVTKSRVVSRTRPAVTVTAAPKPAAAAPSAPAAAAPPATATATTPRPRPAVAAVAASAAQQPRNAAKAGDETHIVQRGESLWSIAADVLGADATPATIAREVNRLWELNKSRIGTGDRNLLMAGTKLRLAS